ncbi:hypothetical protein D7030_04015 [Flavobacteriaceae bacterium AU392]|nr:hypothetical protein D1817_10490 [Flavobacteriaceae bacterium]RKM85842.1 hypothetical protein D7030_04015 [Flavobacteriaceae bacterium AU392]
MEYYEERHIVKFRGNDINFFFNEVSTNNTLSETLSNTNKIILLGSPGIGKTTELEHLFSKLWEEKDVNGVVPIYINLKYFRTGGNFEELIVFEAWKDLPQVVFILDGLDEIVNIQDFISAFQLFTNKNEKGNSKYVISCRTNIYDKYLVDITDFDVFFLKPLGSEQINNFLDNKYGIDRSIFNYNDEFVDLLSSPFFLDLFAEYYKENLKLPEYVGEIWSLYIDRTLKRDKQKFVKRGIQNKGRVIDSLRKIAVVNELRHRNYIDETEMFDVLGDFSSKIIECSLLEKNSSSENWSFLHRQIQEYFVANTLINKTFDEILNFIKIENLDAIYPSVYNSLSFTIDLFEKDNKTLELLLEWLGKNQPDVLFKADSNRLNKPLRNLVFKQYFTNECIEKELWINTNKTIDVKEIASFGDTQENFQFLIGIISENTFHYRARFSAIELISFFNLSQTDKEFLRNFFIDIIPKSENGIIAEIINAILSLEFYKDPKYLNKLLSSIKDLTNKEINRSILNILLELNIDDYFQFLSREFLYAHGLEQRKEIDKVLRGNRYIVNELVLKLKNPENFLELAKHFFNNNINTSGYEEFYNKLIERLVDIIKEDTKYLFKLLSSVGEEYRYLIRKEIFLKIIKGSSNEEKIIEYLLSSYSFENIDYFIARIVTPESLNIVYKYIQSMDLPADKVERFRNFIGNINSRKTAKIFNDSMIERGYSFKEKVLTEENATIQQGKFISSLKTNIDVLFDYDYLIEEFKKIISEYGEITIENIRKIESDWYKSNGSWNFIETRISILSHILFKTSIRKIDEECFKDSLEDKNLILTKLQFLIERYKSSNWNIGISDEQKQIIISWITYIAANIDFKKIIKLHSVGSYSQHYDFDKIKTVFYYQKLLSISLPEEFLLNSIRFYELDKSSELDESFNYLKELINNKFAFDAQIISNIKEGNLFAFSLSKHIAYAIKFELKETYSIIREYFKNTDSVYNESRKLEDYVLVSKDIQLLKEIAIDDESWNHWSALKILVKHNWESEFCNKRALNYLETKKEKFTTEALSILFSLNSPKAITLFLENIEKDGLSKMRYLDLKNYTSDIDNELLKKLYFIFYSKEIDRFDSHHARSFFFSYIVNIGIKHLDNFERINNLLKEIKEIEVAKGNDLFYINLLIDDFNNNYILSKSKPFTLQEALDRCSVLLK